MLQGYLYHILATDETETVWTSWGITFGTNVADIHDGLIANIRAENPEITIHSVNVREYHNPLMTLNNGRLEVPDNYYDYTKIVNVVVNNQKAI